MQDMLGAYRTGGGESDELMYNVFRKIYKQLEPLFVHTKKHVKSTPFEKFLLTPIKYRGFPFTYVIYCINDAAPELNGEFTS